MFQVEVLKAGLVAKCTSRARAPVHSHQTQEHGKAASGRDREGAYMGQKREEKGKEEGHSANRVRSSSFGIQLQAGQKADFSGWGSIVLPSQWGTCIFISNEKCLQSLFVEAGSLFFIRTEVM